MIIRGYVNRNKFPVSIRTAKFSVGVLPGQYLKDGNGNKVTDPKFLQFTRKGGLSVDRYIEDDSEKTQKVEKSEAVAELVTVPAEDTVSTEEKPSLMKKMRKM